MAATGEFRVCDPSRCCSSRPLSFEFFDPTGFGPFRVALEALGFGQVVLVAPVAFVLETGGQAGVAASAFALRDSVFDAPPAVVFAAVFSVLVVVVTVGLCDQG